MYQGMLQASSSYKTNNRLSLTMLIGRLLKNIGHSLKHPNDCLLNVCCNNCNIIIIHLLLKETGYISMGIAIYVAAAKQGK